MAWGFCGTPVGALNGGDQATDGAASDQPTHFGIAAKVVLALLLAFAASLLALRVVDSGFEQIGRRVADLSRLHLPAIARTAELVRESQRLAALGPDILLARTEPMRDELRRNLEQGMAEKNRLMASLNGLGLEPEQLDALERDFNALAARLRTLLGQTGEQMALERQVLERIGQLQRLSQNLRRLEIKQQGRAARCPQHWENLARQRIVNLLATQGAHNEGHLRRQEDNFAFALAEMDKVLACPPGQPSAERLALNEELKALSGPGGMFDLRRRQLDLRYSMESQLVRGRYLGEALLGAVNRVLAKVERDTQKHNLELEAIAHDRMARLAFVPALLLAIAAGTYLYLHRVLLRPIRQLRTAVSDSLGKRPARFPTPGRDEVGTIVRAVRGYIDTLARREEELRRANLAKSLFLAQVSHELRTPLNAILGYASLLGQESGLRQEAQAHGRVIEREGNRLLGLIEDLLDSAAIEAGGLRLAVRETDLPALLGDLEASIRQEAAAKGLTFRAEHGQGLPRLIRADARRLRQVLSNLLVNAIKYTPSGQIRLHTAARLDGEGRARLVFLVADSGPGIPPQEQARLFEPFEQLDPSQPGNGLGLFICRELATLMGGTLSLDSLPGQGSRFMLDLPVETLPELPGLAQIHAAELPPRSEIETILELVELERWDQALDWCDDLAAGFPEYAAYAREVHERIRAGDIADLRRWLEVRETL